MADYDVPANIDYVLAATGFEKLVYVGHSQGTIQMFAALSDNPDLADKLDLFIAVAPVASIVHIKCEFFRVLGDTLLA